MRRRHLIVSLDPELAAEVSAAAQEDGQNMSAWLDIGRLASVLGTPITLVRV